MDSKTFLLRIGICFLLSFLVGIERQYRRRSVGLRTTILVSIGSFLFVLFSFKYPTDDFTRIASQVVTGIGFLGAGVIIKDGINVRGLTTAATLWCDAAIGILCVGGLIFEAIIGTIIILFANIILRFVNQRLNMRKNSSFNYINYSLKIVSKKDTSAVFKKINDLFDNENYDINNIETKELDNGNYAINVDFKLVLNKKGLIEKITQDFIGDKNVISMIIDKISEKCQFDDEEL